MARRLEDFLRVLLLFDMLPRVPDPDFFFIKPPAFLLKLLILASDLLDLAESSMVSCPASLNDGPFTCCCAIGGFGLSVNDDAGAADSTSICSSWMVVVVVDLGSESCCCCRPEKLLASLLRITFIFWRL